MPASNSAVAGAGMLHRPCAISMNPWPVGTADAAIRSAPSRSHAIALPTMSAMESTAPTSWKCTLRIVVPWTLASASPRRVKMRLARSFCVSDRALLVDHFGDVMQMAMGVLRLVMHGDV